MNRPTRKSQVVLAALALLLVSGVLPASANTLSLAELKKLKQENPEEFNRIIQDRKAALKERLQEFKEKHPEKFDALKKRYLHDRWSHLRSLRRRDPEKFQSLMQQRMEKLDEWRAKHPEHYAKFIEKHPRLAERMKHGPRDLAQWEKRREFVQNHPRYAFGRLDQREDRLDRKEDKKDQRYRGGPRDRWEDIQDRHEDYRDRWEDVRDRGWRRGNYH
jgi:hypothetical protein